MSIHLIGDLHPRNPNRPPGTQRLDEMPDEAIRAASKTIRAARSSRRSVLSICALLALIFLNLGCGRAPQSAEKDPPPAPIKWEEARQLFLEEWTELVGSTQPLPDHAARVTSPVAGRVLAVLPKNGEKPIVEGQLVEEGEVLVRLDATAIHANLAKAEAAKKVLQAERDVAAVTVKQASLDVKSLEDLKQTPNTSLVSPIALEKAALALESARASVLALDRKLEAADKEEAALKLEIQLFVLTAPRKGRLGRLQVVIGQTLPAGAAVAEVLGIDDEIDVLCFVSAADARKVQLGQSARVGGFDKDSATEAGADPEGKVVFVADQAEAETGSFAVKIRFPNRDLKLRANSVARVRILTRPGKSCWAVPESALLEDQDPPGIVLVEDVAVTKNAEGKDEQTGKVRRLRAVIGVRDRILHQVEIVRLEDVEKKWRGDLEHALIVIAKGQGLQTGDAVKFEAEDDDEAAKPDAKP
ncbi:efflux RND transporter periplasmic adaptor subunit [Fimbriiglobus ruber]|uniref:Putative RND efflux membrane fusion protein n=1 Tax=Fimbriiglobus ruber TaxID=1908690 RepID=A0A225DNL5_9BACT|nr:HlyD family efflux transporter periplasmic adaptor subunit [Fimbriiglobus ruber]OWK39066.1 putative RND efflux membrane fusion protein [Fimbriiglobus ruber]